MADRVTFRPVAPGDVTHIAAHLRAADRDEVIATRGEGADIEAVIASAVARSVLAWAADDGEPVAVFGLGAVSLLQGIGTPWLLGTDRLWRHPRTLIVEGRRYLSTMRTVYPHLVNYVDARNDVSIRWLKRIGFTLHDPAPYGAMGLPFHKFEV